MFPILKPDKAKALFFAKRNLPEFVYDAINLEGINYTLPEVQTLLDGVTIGGHKLSDQTITLNQAKAWKFLFHALENNNFNLTKDFAYQLHNIAACEEALQWGQFRDGNVTIAGTDYLPPDAAKLSDLWQKMLNNYQKFNNIYQQAIYLFLTIARTQFFYDVNKRLGRFLMNGLLLQHGYLAINVPFKRQLEFNRLMLAFYSNNIMEPMEKFLISCLNKQELAIFNN